MSQKHHWEKVYSDKLTERLGWYKPHLQTSLAWINELNLGPATPIIDVGGGVSTLVDDLLDAGYQSVTVLDISENALSSVRARLGAKGDQVSWMQRDITSADLPAHQYRLWHDRAAFHFLTEPDQRQQYRDQLLKALQPGGNLIIGTFATGAPPKCSGLPVQRYRQDQLSTTLGEEFELVRHQTELHITPGGVEQMYIYCHFHRTD